jgi:chromosome segregation ATPase
LLQVARDEVDGGDSGELLDEAAIDAYRQRVHSLREQAGEHEAQGAEQATQRVRAEIEALEDELSRALGLGGRKRRQGSAVEKARINVQRRIRDALRRIARTSPSLSRYLDKSIKTGTTCVFDP